MLRSDVQEILKWFGALSVIFGLLMFAALFVGPDGRFEYYYTPESTFGQLLGVAVIMVQAGMAMIFFLAAKRWRYTKALFSLCAAGAVMAFVALRQFIDVIETDQVSYEAYLESYFGDQLILIGAAAIVAVASFRARAKILESAD